MKTIFTTKRSNIAFLRDFIYYFRRGFGLRQSWKKSSLTLG